MGSSGHVGITSYQVCCLWWIISYILVYILVRTW
jgi:hypothetical protein